MPIDLRASLNAVSDVVNNRPRPLRKFDQIYMKSADMLLQVDLVSRWFSDKKVIFIGDGDAIGLCLVHLHNSGLLESGPSYVHVLDFDERAVLSIRKFARRFGIADRIAAELYNVADALPGRHVHGFGGFYTNPPFGASNGGKSVEAFCRRGFEAVGDGGIGCLVVADDKRFAWTQEVLRMTEQLILENGFVISEVLPDFHQYHLDDVPDLRSCSLVCTRIVPARLTLSRPLEPEILADFYGQENPLNARYIHDLTSGGKLGQKEYRIEPLERQGS